MANNKSVEEYVEWFKKKDRLGSQFNIKIVSLDGDECVAEYQALEEHYNPNDILHGGALYTVMDSCQGAFLHFAQVPEEYKAAATGTATIKYVKPVFAQELISVRTWLDRQEGRKFYVHSEALNPSGDIVATVEEIWIGLYKDK